MQFAIRLEKSNDSEIRGPLYWGFTAWQHTIPERLLTEEQAKREMARLIELDPRRAAVISLVDVPVYRARCEIYGTAFGQVLADANYDELDAETRKAILPELKIKARAAGDAALVAAGYEPNNY